MSEFDRAENLRRSIRRPRKQQAPMPPDLPQPAARRDFIAAKPIEISDDSNDVLKQIQTQINRLEFDTSLFQKNQAKNEADESNVMNLHGGKLNFLRYDSESEEKNSSEFVRDHLRSSMQATTRKIIPRNDANPPTLNLQRSQSDTKKVEMLRKRIKQRELVKKMEEEKVKRFSRLINNALQKSISRPDKIRYKNDEETVLRKRVVV